jgi:hypothetical protein
VNRRSTGYRASPQPLSLSFLEIHMMKTYASLLALTTVVISLGAQAQSDAAKRLDDIRTSSEQMRPSTNAAFAPRGPAEMESPQSEEEKRLAEIQIGSEQMRPATPEREVVPAPLRPAVPKSASARALDAVQESSEQMKPR